MSMDKVRLSLGHSEMEREYHVLDQDIREQTQNLHQAEVGFTSFIAYHFTKGSKISNTSCLPKRARQTVQAQIRLLLLKQSDQCIHCLLF